MSCRYCGMSGHNRSTCSSNPYRNNASSEKKVRHCSYCVRQGSYREAVGHNRTSCKNLKAAKENWIVKNKEYCRNFLEDINKAGLIPGSLVKYGNYDPIYFVKSIDFHRIRLDTFGWNDAINVSTLGCNLDLVTRTLSTPSWYGLTGEDRQTYIATATCYDTVQVISAPTECKITAPEEWLSGVIGVDILF